MVLTDGPQLEDAKTRAQQWQMTRFVLHRTQMQLPPHSHAWDLHQVGLGPLPELPEATKPFPIDVTDLTGATIKVEASLDTSVDALRALVHDQTGVDPDLQMLLLDNEIPMEDETLALGAYGLRRGLRIQLTPQDPTRAAKRRLLRLEGREAAAAAQECRSRAVSTIGFIMVIIDHMVMLVTMDISVVRRLSWDRKLRQQLRQQLRHMILRG